ncbi:AraC family transcriptional regulator [Poseidonocella sp. HB161398]|uniref:helix-turn-helix domain-containing protein n=1 Tax=Poseidonocella sp. HB161398 TaxID=2320855 RepID=UPI0014861D38|nr:helix-turn-helix transcriptional regulator [Poseidonocella sp. HB161398]
MTRIFRPAPPRRPVPRLHQIKSPLSRIAYALPEGAAHLLQLDHGRVRLRGATADDGPERSGPRLLWWAGGGGRELVAEAGARGMLLSIPAPSLLQALPVSPIGEQMQRTLSQDLELSPGAPWAASGLLEGFAREAAEAEAGAEIAASHYLSLLLLQLWRLARKDLVTPGGAPQGLSERFVLLAAQRARDHLPVGHYARELKVSRDRLGSAVKRATGLSPRAYLHRILLRDAAELLAHTGMPVSRVAFRLGFADPAYFTRFFKRETGQNPAAFRKSLRRTEAAAQTFAAWP